MMKFNAGLGISVAALLLSGSGAAFAQIIPSQPAFGSISSLNVAIGDTFSTAPAASSNPLYNFVDVYTFTFTGAGTGVAAGSAISFSNSIDSSITNLQAAVFAPGSFAAGTYLSAYGDSSSTSTVVGSWTSVSLGTGSTTTFSANLTGGQAYSVEVRGLIGASGASYGGNLQVAAVPEASSLAMLLLGLGGVIFAASRARRGLLST